jgi:hypothetical protein
VLYFGGYDYLAVSQAVKSLRGIEADIHDVSGIGSRSASFTLNQPLFKGIEDGVPLRVIH